MHVAFVRREDDGTSIDASASNSEEFGPIVLGGTDSGLDVECRGEQLWVAEPVDGAGAFLLRAADEA